MYDEIIKKKEYIKKILKRFNMNGVKPVNTPLIEHHKMSMIQSPKNNVEIKMSQVPYASVMKCLMYVMICTKPDITHRFIKHPNKECYILVK